MTDRPSRKAAIRKWGRRMAAVICGLFIIVFALLVLGAYVPSIPYVGIFGSVFLSIFSGWAVLVPLLPAFLAWKLTLGWTRWALVTPAVLTSVGAAIILISLISVARANDVRLSIGDPFGLTGNWKKPPPDETVVYATDLEEELSLLIYRPSGDAPSGGWPVLMYVHGGGWIEGDNKARSADWRWFADRGWMVVSAGYSLSTDSRHLWDRVVSQIGCAMAWTGKNIASRGGDPSRLALIGESAGGNLVLNAAYMGNAGQVQSICGGALPRVHAVSAIYPGVDLSVIRSSDPLLRNALPRMVEGYTGGTAAQFPDRYRQVASATHINPAAPPTLVFVSENDHLVPARSMHRFVAEARKGGVDVREVSVPYAEHGFDAAGIGNQIVRQATLGFLNQHVRRAAEQP